MQSYCHYDYRPMKLLQLALCVTIALTFSQVSSALTLGRSTWISEADSKDLPLVLNDVPVAVSHRSIGPTMLSGTALDMTRGLSKSLNVDEELLVDVHEWLEDQGHTMNEYTFKFIVTPNKAMANWYALALKRTGVNNVQMQASVIEASMDINPQREVVTILKKKKFARGPKYSYIPSVDPRGLTAEENERVLAKLNEAVQSDSRKSVQDVYRQVGPVDLK